MNNSLLYPLDAFYSRAQRPLPAAAAVLAAEVPEPYRSLLVHDRDMTPTLEAYHGEAIHLKLVDRFLQGDAYSRLVALILNGRGLAAEVGAIVIYLDAFPPEAREEILDEFRPLGTILARHDVQRVSCPQAFVRVHSDELIGEALSLSGPTILFGRRNLLSTPGGRVLADILEILPP